MRLLSYTLAALPVINALQVSTSGRCGASFGLTCSGSSYGNCCSKYNYCGKTADHCSTDNGCQSGYGTCSGSAPAPQPSLPSVGKVSTNGRCGAGHNGMTCLGSKWGDCCSQYSYCGTSDGYCASGCQAGYGKCNGVSPPVESPASPSSAIPAETITVTVTQGTTATSTISGEVVVSTVTYSTTQTIPTTITLSGEDIITITVPGEGAASTSTYSTTVTIPTTISLPGEVSVSTLTESVTVTVPTSIILSGQESIVSMTETATLTNSVTVTNTITATATETLSITNIATVTDTATETLSITNIATVTDTATETVSITNIATVTDTATETLSITNIATVTDTATETVSITNIATVTDTATETLSITNMATETVSITNIATVTDTATETLSITNSVTITNTVTSTATLTTCTPPKPSVTQAILNSGFETSDSWTFNAGFSGTWQYVSSNQNSGSRALQYSSSSSSELTPTISQTVALYPNAVYRLQFYGKATPANNCQVSAKLGSTSVTISSPYLSSNYASKSAVFYPVAGVQSAVLTIQATCAQGSNNRKVYFDDVTLTIEGFYQPI